LTFAQSKVVAAFDFDGTITDHDSLRDFLHFSLGSIGYAAALIKAAPQLYGCYRGRVDRQSAKEALLTASFGGKSVYEVDSWATQFAKKVLPRILRPAAVKRMLWHQAQGHHVVIVSASPALYIKPWAKLVGVQTVLASELEEVDRFYTGKLQGRNCWGEEKVNRLIGWWGFNDPDFLYAYGDSRGDAEMLRLADEPWFQGAKIEEHQLLF
jgi:phosphatidylglycerophosphatase C